MGWKKSGPPTAFRMETGMERSTEKIVNMQNKHYTDKIKLLNNKFPVTNYDPLKVLKDALDRWGTKTDNIKIFKLQPVGRNHTMNLIKKLGNSTSFGFDGIDSTSLKLVTEEIADPINCLVNLSIKT